jgi:uncharacterized protein
MAPAVSLTHARALVTGASSGIGALFAERLARQGHDLVLVARRRDRLERLAARLRDEFGVEADVLVADLTDANGIAQVEARVAGDDALAMLVNNAGFGGYKPFVSVEPKLIDDLINIHIRAVARLSRAAVPGMIRRGAGAIINVASLLALSGTLPPNPLPHRATYAGAKAFMVAFTQALAGELTGSGVKVQVCLPGVIDTEFHTVQGIDTQKIAQKMAATDVVTASLAALKLGETVCVPALADPTLLARLAEAQVAVLRAGAMQSVALAQRYR